MRFATLMLTVLWWATASGCNCGGPPTPDGGTAGTGGGGGTGGACDQKTLCEQVAYVSDYDRPYADVIVANLDGTGRGSLGIFGEGSGPTGRPSLSASGTSLVIPSIGRGGGGAQLLVTGLRGEGAHLVMGAPFRDQILGAALSPDATRVVFSFAGNLPPIASAGTDSELYIVNADGSQNGLQRLTTNDAEDVDPAFSLDGTRLAFASNRDGNYEIYVMKLDGTEVARLTHEPADDVRPAFTPDGRIVFTSRRDGNSEIYLTNVDGTGLLRLTNDPADDDEPAVSGDGKRVVFTSRRDGNREIYVMALDGADVTRLTNDLADERSPVIGHFAAGPAAAVVLGDFALQLEPAGQLIAAGSSGTFSVSAQFANGLIGPVALTSVPFPAGTIDFASSMLTPQAPSTAATVTVSADFFLDSRGATGDALFFAKGAAGMVTRQAKTGFKVSGFSASIEPEIGFAVFSPPETKRYSVTVTPLMGFVGTVHLSIDREPAPRPGGGTVGLLPTMEATLLTDSLSFVAGDGPKMVSVDLQVNVGTTLGTYVFDVVGAAGAVRSRVQGQVRYQP